jgi:hypothetical protein
MFEQMKAKLGLDVTDFERGVAKAQGSLSTIAGSATKKFTDLKNVGQTVATALGLSLESISEGLARMIVGFSKEQEAALNRMAVAAKNAADQMGTILFSRQGADDPEKRIKLLDRELQSVRLQAQARTKLTAAEKREIKSKEGDIFGTAKIRAIEESLAASQQEAAIRIGQINRERLIAEGDLKKKNAEKEKKDIEAIEKSFKAAADEREKQKFKELSIDGKIASKQADLAKAQKAANDQTKGGVQRAEAVAKAQQLQSDIKDLQLEKTEAAADAEKRLEDAVSGVVNMLVEASAAEKTRTDELAKQTAELKKQGRATEDNMKAQRRQAELPTMADVISGKRNIGSVGKNRATKLERDREKAARLSDAEQRAREAFSGATTESARAAALENGRRIRAQLDATRGQIANAEGLLTTRVADANPYAAMEKELTEIKGQLKTLNETTLAPTKIK